MSYHTLYFTHLYLQQPLEDFRPCKLHREDFHDWPWPPGSARDIADPDTKGERLSYGVVIDGLIDAAVDALDLDAPGSGFPWHAAMPKLEHQLHNIQHIQHHAALLSGRLRRLDGTEVRWVRTG